MGIEATFLQLTSKVSTFWTNSFNRLQMVRQKVQAGSFTANDLANDAAAMWIEAVDILGALLPSSAQTVLPVVFITAPAAAGGKRSGHAILGSMQDPANPVAFTDIQKVQGPWRIAQAPPGTAGISGELNSSGTELDVALEDPTNAAKAPALPPPGAKEGLYLGMASVAGEPVAIIWIELT